MFKRRLAMAILSVAMAGNTFAAGLKDSFIYSPHIGYHMYDEERSAKSGSTYYGLKNNLTGGLTLEKVFTNFGVGIMFGYGQTAFEGVDVSRDSYDWAVFGSYYSPVNERLYPFVSLGIGGNALNHKTLTGIYGALGVRYLIWNNIGVKLALQGLSLWKGRYDLIPTVGVDIVFGGEVDSDRDGVVDSKDMCPDTPIGVKVDENGCPLDSDKDGIADYLDKCPDTPIGVKVDNNGCPLDSDKDGVPDYLDRCPDTPAGVNVDKNGCPIDSDKDGVPDYLDKCSNTPVGVKVDENGCPIDSDKDGVADYLDKCPDTPIGVKVDNNGCPLDSDKDGVPDYLDRCPNTPEGYKVDEKGCFVEARLEIHFDVNSAKIKPEYMPEIEKFAKFLKENPNIKVEIQGHTDSTGSEEYNLRLSQKRAEAVRKVLIEKYGISPDRVIAKGYGESMPIAPNDTEEGRAKNRRVIAKIIK